MYKEMSKTAENVESCPELIQKPVLNSCCFMGFSPDILPTPPSPVLAATKKKTGHILIKI